ncbi:unnamed protein product, partial [Allacma fusca]
LSSHSCETISKLCWAPELALQYVEKLSQIETKDRTLKSSEEIISFLNNSIRTVAKDIGMTRKITRNSIDHSKPWYNHECREAKKNVKNAHKQLRKAGYSTDEYKQFVQIRSEYRFIIKSNKKTYIDSIKAQLKECNSSPTFWRTIARLRKRKPAVKNDISKDEWEAHFKSLMGPRRPTNNTQLSDPRHPTLDADISYEECLNAQKRIRTGKSPGCDGIPGEFLKYLPVNFVGLYNKLFNNMLTGGPFPAIWGDIEIVTIYKKGDIRNPSNYRGISLINSALKWFTQIILSRLNE